MPGRGTARRPLFPASSASRQPKTPKMPRAVLVAERSPKPPMRAGKLGMLKSASRRSDDLSSPRNEEDAVAQSAVSLSDPYLLECAGGIV